MTNIRKNTLMRFGKKRKNLIFYFSVLAFPILQFLVFYVGVNINSFALAFKKYDYYIGKHSWVGLSNFADVIGDLFGTAHLRVSLTNSLILFAATMFVGCTLALLFSYYIYKKALLYKMFKIILFLPYIISSITMVIVYKYFVESAIPSLVQLFFDKKITGLLTNYDTKFFTILFFTIWTGFGIQSLVYSSAMSGISESVVESAKLDGITPLKEFIYISVPMIYPTVTVFIVAGMANIFVNQMNVYSFYGQMADDYNIYTIGYFLYKSIASQNTTIADYPYLSAFGLLLTFITAPVTLGVKSFLEKIGPSSD